MNGFSCNASPGTIAAAIAMAGAVGAIALPGIWRRGPRRYGERGRRGAALVALAAALLGLVGLVVRPAGGIPPGDRGRAVLLTPGEDDGAVTGAGREDGGRAALRVAHTGGGGRRGAGAADGGGAGDRGGAGWEVLPDARTLWRREPWLRRLEVRGYGLDAADFAGYEGAIDRFSPPALPAGVMAALWPRRVQLGAPLVVQLRAAPATTGRVDLIGPGGVEAGADAATARRGVTLTVRPKAAGRLLYRLVARNAAGGVIASEPLDVAVESPRPPRVLALFGAPSFENRALLRFLAAAQIPFAASLELTRGRAHVEASWRPAFGPPLAAAAPLTAATLARCDALLLDGRGWKALPPGERSVVGAAVLGGLGVLLFAADSAQDEEGGFLLRSRPLARAALAPTASAASAAPAREVRLTWPGQESLAPLALPSREIAPAAGEEPLIGYPEGPVVAARLRRGRGVVALSVVEESFPWTLGADRPSYEAFWARLLSAVARPDAAPTFVLPGGPLLADRPLDVALLSPAPSSASAASGAPSAKAPSVELVAGDSALPVPLFAIGPGRFASRLWPRAEGWLRLVSTDGASAWLYAGGPRSWQSWQLAGRVAATAARAAQPATAELDLPAVTPRPWPRLPLYLLFLAGASWLWFEERVRTGP
jgi:hypothetical protein